MSRQEILNGPRVDRLASGPDRTLRLPYTLDGDLPPDSRVVTDLFDAPIDLFPGCDRRLQQDGGSGLAFYYPVSHSIEYISGPDGDPHATTVEILLTGLNIPPNRGHVQVACL